MERLGALRIDGPELLLGALRIDGLELRLGREKPPPEERLGALRIDGPELRLGLEKLPLEERLGALRMDGLELRLGVGALRTDEPEERLGALRTDGLELRLRDGALRRPMLPELRDPVDPPKTRGLDERVVEREDERGLTIGGRTRIEFEGEVEREAPRLERLDDGALLTVLRELDDGAFLTVLREFDVGVLDRLVARLRPPEREFGSNRVHPLLDRLVELPRVTVPEPLERDVVGELPRLPERFTAAGVEDRPGSPNRVHPPELPRVDREAAGAAERFADRDAELGALLPRAVRWGLAGWPNLVQPALSPRPERWVREGAAFGARREPVCCALAPAPREVRPAGLEPPRPDRFAVGAEEPDARVPCPVFLTARDDREAGAFPPATLWPARVAPPRPAVRRTRLSTPRCWSENEARFAGVTLRRVNVLPRAERDGRLDRFTLRLVRRRDSVCGTTGTWPRTRFAFRRTLLSPR